MFLGEIWLSTDTGTVKPDMRRHRISSRRTAGVDHHRGGLSNPARREPHDRNDVEEEDDRSDAMTAAPRAAGQLHS
jgi:hypothetical protein